MTDNPMLAVIENYRKQMLREVMGLSDADIDSGQYDHLTIEEMSALERRRWLEANNETELDGDRLRLCELMSDISEEAYCAGWMRDNEYRLWAMLVEPDDSRVYSRADVTEEAVMEMRRLSDAIGGWIEFVIGDAFPRGSWGERFVPMAEWLPRFAAWRQEYPGPLS